MPMRYLYHIKRSKIMLDGFIKIACAQGDIKVANTEHNTRAIIADITRAYAQKAKVIIFPELCVTGYTCGDLFLQTELLRSAQDALFEIAESAKDMDIIAIVGAPLINGFKLYNCAVAIYRGDILAVVPKRFMPTHGEFYELRHFAVPSDDLTSITLRGKEHPFGKNIVLTNKNMPEMAIGIEICEDLWVPCPPSSELAMRGASIIANISAGDEIIGKADYRRGLVMGQSARLVCCYAYSKAGMGESTTDMVFSGHSMICENGSMLCESKPFEGNMIITETDVMRLVHERQRLTSFEPLEGARRVYFDMPLEKTVLTRNIPALPFVPSNTANRESRAREILLMQAYGLKKRIEHTGAKKLVLGISGGLDSTLALIVCTMAADLTGKAHDFIHAVTMPCFGTTSRTKSNAQKLCEQMNVSFEEVNISDAVTLHMKDIGHDESNHNVVYENAQARMRTLVLMNLSNKLSGFVVGTGDLSELALGWATYNGDHMSMYGVNASIPKTLIKHLIRYYADTCGNSKLKSILYDILDTPISPELLPADDKGNITQKTEDLVGPYELHDFFLYYMLRFGFTPKKIYRLAMYAFDESYDGETVLKWLKTFYRRFFAQQFKRSCLPDGAKVGSVSLSPRGDFRMPSDADYTVWKNELESIKA